MLSRGKRSTRSRGLAPPSPAETLHWMLDVPAPQSPTLLSPVSPLSKRRSKSQGEGGLPLFSPSIRNGRLLRSMRVHMLCIAYTMTCLGTNNACLARLRSERWLVRRAHAFVARKLNLVST